MKPDIWMDGVFVPWNEASIHPLSHSMQRGATLFESIDCLEALNGKPAVFRLDDHLRRFENSASIVGISIGFSNDILRNAIIETIARSGMKQCTIRPLAFYADPVFDINPGDSRVSVVIGLGEKKPLKESIRISVSRLRKIDSSSMPVKAKVSGNYISAMIAKSEALRAGFDDTVLLDKNGYVAEGATANIFIVENGKVVTSPDNNILKGITRQTIMSLTGELNIPLVEDFYFPERMLAADEVFISSSGLGVMPVVQIDNATVGTGMPGPLSNRLRTYYREVVTGAIPSFEHWLTYVEPLV